MLFYEVAWSGNDFTVLTHVSGPTPTTSVHPAQGTGVWAGEPWDHFGTTLTIYKVPTESLKQFQQMHGVRSSEELLFRRLVAMGILYLSPSSAKWSGNEFTARLTTGTRISGTLGATADGRVETLEYGDDSKAAVFRIRYGYGIELPFELPCSLVIERHAEKGWEFSQSFEILDWKERLDGDSFADFAPQKVFASSRVVLYTGGAFYQRDGKNLRRLSPVNPLPTRTHQTVKRFLVISIILASAIPFAFLLVRLVRRQHQQPKQ